MHQTALKRSTYLVISPGTFRSADGTGYRIAYASRTATTFRLLREEADLLESGRIDELPPALVDRLIRMEALVPGDEDELAEQTRRRKVGSAPPRLRRFAILPTSYCNMGCTYCGQAHTKSTVSHPRVRQQIDRVLAGIADPGTTAVHISWFGGEPLLGLRVIREISAEVVPAMHASGKAFSADVVSNGSLLSHRVLRDLYEECQVRWFEVTIDGPQETHDRRRAMRNGSGTFERIVTVLSETIEQDLYPELQFGIRTNVDHENQDLVADLIAELARRGLASPRIILKPAPVHSWGNDVSDRMLGRWEYARREMDWVRLAQDLGMTMPPGLPRQTKPATCVATSRSSEVTDANGKLFTCTEHVLVPSEAHGQVATLDLLPAAELRPLGPFDSWYDEVAAGDWQCSSCPFLPVCGGGCPKLWKEGELPCPSYKFNWTDRLTVQALRRGLTADV
jgi:uncharacterized protein